MNLKNKCKIIEFNEFNDERGKLVAIESFRDIPFEIKRVFFIYGVAKDVVRGRHANKESEFVLINLRGSCKIKLYEGEEELIIELKKPNVGLYIPKLVWKDMYDFSDDSLLLSLSSEYYDKEEYLK